MSLPNISNVRMNITFVIQTEEREVHSALERGAGEDAWRVEKALSKVDEINGTRVIEICDIWKSSRMPDATLIVDCIDTSQ